MNESDTIEQGRAALERIRDRSRRQFADWFDVGAALIVGRTECLRLAGTNSTHSPNYRLHFRRWLDGNGFDIDGHERDGSMWMVAHKAEVTRWRDGLDEAGRRHCNHPTTVRRHFQAGTKPQPRGPRKGALRAPAITTSVPAPAIVSPQEAGPPLAPFDPIPNGFVWPDEARRRVLTALRNTAGQPLAVQADAALKAAIRGIADCDAYRAMQVKPAPKKRANAQLMAEPIALHA